MSVEDKLPLKTRFKLQFTLKTYNPQKPKQATLLNPILTYTRKSPPPQKKQQKLTFKH